MSSTSRKLHVARLSGGANLLLKSSKRRTRRTVSASSIHHVESNDVGVRNEVAGKGRGKRVGSDGENDGAEAARSRDHI